jgi:CHAT domain-containing protein
VLWVAHAGAANAWTRFGDAGAASLHFEAALRVIETAWSELNSNEHKITFLASLIHFYQDYVDALMSRGETEKALAIADRSRARLLAQRLARNISPTVPDVRAVARKSRSVWLCYWLGQQRSFLWVVTPTTVRAFPLPPASELEPQIREYRGFIEASMRDPMVTPSEAGRFLYEKLVSPALPFLEKQANVIIVPDGVLHQLSFDTLPAYSSTSEPRYLMDDYTIAIAPSMSVYRGTDASTPSASIKGALIVGNPLSPGPEFPDLPYAAKEIATVQGRLSAMKTRVITREAARSDVWGTANPGQYSVIHIAAHAEANEKNPLLSAIILSPQRTPRLFARDIIDVPLQAQLVTLSACRSSGARTYRGEGLVGFAWAFLQAGSRSVIAGLWDVADESTSILMDHLYEGISRDESPAYALRAARLALRKTTWSKPYYWGPFQCYVR